LSSLKSFFKDTVIYGIAAVLPRVISIAIVPVFTAVLAKDEFSDQTTWYVYAAFINVLLTLGMETAFFRFYTTEKNKENVLSSSFSLLIFSSLSFALIGTLLSKYFSPSLGFSDPLFIQILVWTTALDTLVVIPFALLRVSNRPIKFMVIKLLNVLIYFLLTSFFLLLLPKYAVSNSELLHNFGINIPYKPSVFHIIISNLFASFITLLLLAPEIFKIKWSLDKELIHRMLRYSMPIMIGGIAYAINENIDKLIIQKLMDKEANGVYAACYKLGVFMTLYITAFRMGAEPFFFNQAASSDAKQKYSKIMTWFVHFGLPFYGICGRISRHFC
jgi:O-antigen/teichoic acid export membrane protein